MKIAVIGAGSTYTPELIQGLIEAQGVLKVSEVALMDTNEARLRVLARFSQRMMQRTGAKFNIEATTDLHEAVQGAQFVLTQIRVGGARARIRDERLGMRHGIIGQETTGIGGFACALRTIPQILHVARAMETHAPDAFLINFSNPSGIVTEALIKHSSVKAVGLCNIPIGISVDIASCLKCSREDISYTYVGLNHLSWIFDIRNKSHDVNEVVLAYFQRNAEEEWGDAGVCKIMRAKMREYHSLLNPYLQYFYAPKETLAQQSAKPETRGEEVLKIEEALFTQYRDPAVDEKPELLSQRGGAHYSTAAIELMRAIVTDSAKVLVVSCRNEGAIEGLEDDVAVEVPAVITATGSRALRQPEPPEDVRRLLEEIKRFETLTVEASLSGDREVALEALSTHPLIRSAANLEEIYREVLESNFSAIA